MNPIRRTSMKLNKLLLCSLFVLTGCNNNGIKTYKELPEVNNEQVKVDEPDDVKDIVGKNAYLSYQFNKANPIDEPLPAIKEDSYNEIATETTKMDVKLESYNQTWATSLDDFAHYFGTYVINRRSYCVPLMDHNHEALKLYFKKMFCNAAYQIDDRETHIYSFKVNKLSLRTTSLKKLGQSNINSCYNEDFEKAYTEILQEKQSESTINNFLRKYGVGIFDTAVYASYDIEITSFRVHFANIGRFMSEFNETGVVPGASIDDHYRFTTFDTATNQYQEKLLSYEIIPFIENDVFPDIWYREDAYNYFVEVYNNFIANESERVLKGEHIVQVKQPKMIMDLHYQVDNITTEAKFSSSKPYIYEYSLKDDYKSYDLDKLKELGYKKMYIRPGLYADQITNRTKVTFEVTVGDQKITVFNKKQLVKSAGVNEINIPWYELDFEKVLASDRKVSCKVTPYGTKARIPLVEFDYAYAM